ncbi:MAG: OsmC family protein [bacterium]|nr:OsmC family protein [bacterium]
MAQIKKVTVESKLSDKFTVESDIRGHKIFVDQPVQAGGDDKGPTPLEYLFVSLGGCIGTIAKITANQKRLKIDNLKIRIDGELDLDILMGKSKDNRAGFSKIVAEVSFDSDMTIEEKKNFIKEVDERCPISDNIMNLTAVEFVVKE